MFLWYTGDQMMFSRHKAMVTKLAMNSVRRQEINFHSNINNRTTTLIQKVLPKSSYP